MTVYSLRPVSIHSVRAERKTNPKSKIIHCLGLGLALTVLVLYDMI